MSWLILFFAGLLETVWAIGLKYTEGFTKPIPTIGTILAMAASVWMLAIAMKELPVGTAYAIWTGTGAVGAVLLGMAFLNEPVTFARLGCIGLIVSGLIGLKLAS